MPRAGASFSGVTVREHLAFGLAVRREPKARIAAGVQELAELLNIEPLLHRLPLGLSGGERQRVALGRALSFRPGILLLDEPLCAVDEDTRDDMVALLRRVQTDSGATVLHITHNPVDAVRLADLVLRLENGTVKA